MSPPEYAGEAKQNINIEGHLFTLGFDKHSVQVAEAETDKLIELRTVGFKVSLCESRDINREARSMLPCCASCGKYNPHKRLF